MVRIALIGCDANAAPYLAAARQLPNTAITAVADADPARADRAARTAGAAARAGTLDELLDSAPETFDAIIVTTPAPTHATLMQRAAQAGKHILVEPPLAPTADEAQQVAATGHTAGVRLMLAHPARFRADHRAVKASLDDGELGRPGLLRIHQWFSATAVMDGRGHAIHGAAYAALDLALWMFGGRPEQHHTWHHPSCGSGLPGGLPTHVYAVARPARTTDLAAAEYAQVHLGFAGGGMALIDVAHTLPTGDGYDSLTLIGSLGAAYADTHHNVQLLYGGGHPQAVRTEPDESAVALLLAEFAAAIAEQREPAVGGADGHAALLVAAAVESSLGAAAAMTLTEGHYACA